MFTHVLHPRFSDIDVYGHVNNAVYLTYFEEARVAFGNIAGLRRLYSRTCSTIVAHAEVDYKAPAFLGDELHIDVATGTVGRSSFEYQYEVRRPASGTRIAIGRTVQVCFNFELGAVVRVPEEWRSLLTSS
ncbi:MAG: thioesterase family protein [Chloroflexi bacterium]|nr:thioesterase family protein [Chloroflexota bacterium]